MASLKTSALPVRHRTARITSELDVIDPVCGTALQPTASVAERWHGMAVYHFCSQRCVDAFTAAPDRYAGPEPPGVDDLEDFHVERVTDDGLVVCTLPGGASFSFQIELDMVCYYRRLIPPR